MSCERDTLQTVQESAVSFVTEVGGELEDLRQIENSHWDWYIKRGTPQ